MNDLIDFFVHQNFSPWKHNEVAKRLRWFASLVNVFVRTLKIIPLLVFLTEHMAKYKPPASMLDRHLLYIYQINHSQLII